MVGYADPSGPVPPVVSATDKNSVDLVSGGVQVSVADASVGNGDLSLSHVIYPGLGGYYPIADDSYRGGILQTIDTFNNPIFSVYWNGKTSNFTFSTLIPVSDNGERLVDNGNNTYTFTLKDGTAILMDTSRSVGYTKIYGFATRLTRPSGQVLNMNYTTFVCGATNCPGYPSGTTDYRLQSVTSNFGLQLQYIYSTTSYIVAARQPAQVVAFNTATDYCDPTANSCSFSQSWPTATYSWPSFNSSICANADTASYTLSITDMAGRVTTMVLNALGQPTSMTQPGNSTPNLTYSYFRSCVPGGAVNATHVNAVTRNGSAWSYAYYKADDPSNPNPNHIYYQSTDPVSGHLTALISATGPIDNLIMPDGANYAYSPNETNHITSLVKPEGGALTYAYDARGNLTSVTEAPKPGSPLSSRTLLASYDTTCTSPAKCNKPNWVQDANGNQTDYTYDTTTGLPLTVTGPAGASGVRPQTRFTYVQRSAWYKNSSGSYVQSTAPIWLLSQTSTCKTSAPGGINGCSVAGDSVVTTYEYGPDSGPNNLFLRGKVVDAGGLALRTCYAYDTVGNKVSETTPRAGLTSCP